MKYKIGFPQEVNLGSAYTEEELRFMIAMDRYKREQHRPFPAWSEVLGVLKSLGYRKEDASDQLRD